MVGSTLRIEAAGETDRGRRRPYNEDAIVVFPEIGLYAVADGVSTRPQGDLASELSLERISAFLRGNRTWPLEAGGQRTDPLAFFSAAVKDANVALHQHGRGYPKSRGPATTFAGLLIADDRACVAHVGDSRIYLLRDREFQALTEDHSYANELIRRGAPPEQAHGMVNAKVLSRALGLDATVDVSVRLVVVQAGDVFLACTDGLHGLVSEGDIAEVLAEMAEPFVAAERLIGRANEAGGRDNISVVVVRIHDSVPHAEGAEVLPVSTIRPSSGG